MALQGKCALVTGAGGGIGTAIVNNLRANGVRVCITDKETMNVEADAAIPGDLADPAFCDAIPRQAAAILGGLDFVFNNAGAMRRGKITEVTDRELRTIMKINVEAPFRICRSAIPILKARGGGTIVNTSSCWGLQPGPGHPLYVMSKAAVASLTKCLAMDHGEDNIRVNAICPNEVDTPMLRSGFATRGLNPDTAIADLNKTVPLGHIASPEEIADVALFLVSDQARYVTGACVEINGGKAVY